MSYIVFEFEHLCQKASHLIGKAKEKAKQKLYFFLTVFFPCFKTTMKVILISSYLFTSTVQLEQTTHRKATGSCLPEPGR